MTTNNRSFFQVGGFLERLNIIIVNWELKEDTVSCIDSLLAAGASLDQIILVDNGSKDRSVEFFLSNFGQALLILNNPNNIGFAAACNQGIQYALDSGAYWILILNNDTTVASDFFQEIERSLATCPSCTILSPAIYYKSNPDRVWYLSDQLIPGTLITIHRFRGRPLPVSLPELIPTDFANGCAMLVKSDVFESIGLFDPSLVMYGEEVDFCWRARLAGFSIIAATKAKVWHEISVSSNRIKTNARYLQIRNQIRFYRNYSQGFQIPIMFLYSTFRILILMIKELHKFHFMLIPPIAQGWFDGWRGITWHGQSTNNGNGKLQPVP